MVRSIVAVAVLMMAANLASAATSSVPIIIFTPALQPGDACIPDGVGSGEETRTAKGDPVLAVRIHGANATRCPNPAFPNLATTEKIPSDEARRTPSEQCVSQPVKVGDELTIPSYGRATVLETSAQDPNCRDGVRVKVVAASVARAVKVHDESTRVPVYEPTDADIQQEYERMIAAVPPAQEYHARHILTNTRADAVAALAQIHAGRSFSEVAAEMSIDTGSKTKGGDLGWSLPSFFIEEFSKSMVSLAPSGMVTEPVKSKFGWHVIELLETKLGKESFPPLSSIKGRIATRLKNLHRAASAPPVPAKAVCRKMVAPILAATNVAAPPKGTVVAEVRVENGRVVDILKLSGPSELHAAVTDALRKYECDRLDRPVVATQSFDF